MCSTFESRLIKRRSATHQSNWLFADLRPVGYPSIFELSTWCTSHHIAHDCTVRELVSNFPTLVDSSLHRAVWMLNGLRLIRRYTFWPTLSQFRLGRIWWRLNRQAGSCIGMAHFQLAGLLSQLLSRTHTAGCDYSCTPSWINNV